MEDFLDAYGNVIDPAEAKAMKQSPPTAKQVASSADDSDTESNISKGAGTPQQGQKEGGKKKKKQGWIQQSNISCYEFELWQGLT